jgi:hypothetical protein
MRYIVPHHNLELTLEVILEHMLRTADVAEWLDQCLK